MPALIACADGILADSSEAEYLRQVAVLRDAGTDLLWLRPAEVGIGLVLVTSSRAMNLAWERGQAPAVVFGAERIAGIDPLPLLPWLAAELASGEFDRVLVLAPGAESGAAEMALARRLLAAGAEAVELLPAAVLPELGQSWISGRRAGPALLARAAH
ncbi:MAG: hypothetical protein ACRD2F_01770 [Terriglobales bacterium]